MTETELSRWQKDAKGAFTWLVGMYEQAQILLDDASRYFGEAGWDPRCAGGLGGVAMSQADLSAWPFVYLKALAMLPKNFNDDANSGTLPVFGIFFYDGERMGPMCFAGAVKWKKEPRGDHWALYDVMTGYKDRFRWTTAEDAWIRCAVPTAEGIKKRPQIEEVRWFELPLGSIATAKQLKSMVEAAIAMAQGSDSEALAFQGS